MPFYRDPPELLSQGDIVRNVPWGLIEAPTSLCRPADRRAPNGKARYSSLDPWAISNAPAPWSQDPEFIHAVGWQGLGMIVWHDCQIEKSDNQERDRPQKAFAGIAPVMTLSVLQTSSAEKTGEIHDSVRTGSNYTYFFLPSVTVGEFTMPESFVNLRHIWPVRQSSLYDRLASLHPDVIPNLYEHMFVFFTRFRLDHHPTCPSCGTEVKLAADQAEQA